MCTLGAVKNNCTAIDRSLVSFDNSDRIIQHIQ